MKQVIFILLSVFLLFSCSEHRKRGETLSLDTADSLAVGNSYDSIVDSQQKAKQDSSYFHSETYRYVQENYHRGVAEKTKGMSHAAQLLYEYGVAVNALFQAEKNTKQNPTPQSEQRIQMLGDNAMRLYEKIKTMHLSKPEQHRFEELNKKTIK
jgi:hypothetical protein